MALSTYKCECGASRKIIGMYDLIKSVKEAFDKGGISIPYPHVVEITK